MTMSVNIYKCKCTPIELFSPVFFLFPAVNNTTGVMMVPPKAILTYSYPPSVFCCFELTIYENAVKFYQLVLDFEHLHLNCMHFCSFCF